MCVCDTRYTSILFLLSKIGTSIMISVYCDIPSEMKDVERFFILFRNQSLVKFQSCLAIAHEKDQKVVEN